MTLEIPSWLFIANIFARLYFMTALEEGTERPPERPPDDIIDELTMYHKIPLEFYYVDDTNGGKGTHFKYSKEEIMDMISRAKRLIEVTLKTSPPLAPDGFEGSKVLRLSDVWLIHALWKYSVKGKDIAIYGSMTPWYESIVLAMGARSVTVIEYNKLTYDLENITAYQPHELPSGKLFDILLSISSFDHDGLGRYGDPINPNADLQIMGDIKKLLPSEGKLFLTVPVGPDVVVWNLHRRYGEIRLPVLLQDWLVVETFGWNEVLLTKPLSWLKSYEPVFVLKPKSKDEL